VGDWKAINKFDMEYCDPNDIDEEFINSCNSEYFYINDTSIVCSDTKACVFTDCVSSYIVTDVFKPRIDSSLFINHRYPSLDVESKRIGYRMLEILNLGSDLLVLSTCCECEGHGCSLIIYYDSQNRIFIDLDVVIYELKRIEL
jgi:hypothetical protein